MKNVPYPFSPKSTAFLKQGQYWSFELSNGRFATGVVLALASKLGKPDSRTFVAGLLDLVTDAPPSPSEVLAAQIKDCGFAHIRTIQRNGTNVLGEVKRAWGCPEMIDLRANAPNRIHVWGVDVIRCDAELAWGDAEAMRAELKASWDAHPRMKRKLIGG